MDIMSFVPSVNVRKTDVFFLLIFRPAPALLQLVKLL